MAKKKKSQLKPVARGFATTSVPKKLSPPLEGADEEELQDTLPIEEVSNVSSGDITRKEGTSSQTEDAFDPEKVELQVLVDKYQEKTEKEISRTIKLIEADRRFAITLPYLSLDPLYRDQILALASELMTGKTDGQKPLEEPEEKMVTRLAITYGVLRRLGFTEERVEGCLRSMNGIELEEAYEWLAVHCSENELEERTSLDLPELKTPRMSAKQETTAPRTPRSPSQFLADFSRPKVKGLDVNASPFVPRHLHPAEPNSVYITHDADDSDSVITDKQAILIDESAHSTDVDAESSDVDDPNAEYVRLKLKFDILKQQAPVPEKQLQMIERQLHAITSDLLFDEQNAEAHYRSEKSKAIAIDLQKRLRISVPSALYKEASPKPRKLLPEKQLAQPVAPLAQSSVFDDDDSGESLLGLLEPPLQQEITSTGVVITLRDMALPKHWSGRTPKILLRERVTKVDRYAAISFSILSGGSRAKRASVSVLWEGRKRDDWSMEDVACHDESQAEQYIATVALHALTFPPTDGFAAYSSLTGNQTFFRSLPSVFRDLWDELETRKRLQDEKINRGVWSKIRSIVELKAENTSKTMCKAVRPTSGKEDPTIFRTPADVKMPFNPQLAENFASRQSSPSYQEMLIQRNTLPIAQYRERIIQILEQSQVLVLSGETGCGKSTQVPAFILEDQLSRGRHCKVYCTEPRRISAISLAQRVSRELGEPAHAVGTMNSLVGYSIRLESNISRNTRLAYVTNGIALRMLESGTGVGGQDKAFDEITHIIIDEVHERTIESDFLLIILKSLLEERQDLKVILMSATVDAEKISDYFGKCPTLHIPGRTFPVDVRFLEDAVEFTKWVISENSPYAKRLNHKFYKGKARLEWTEEMLSRDDDDGDDDTVATSKEDIKLEKRYSSDTVSTLNLFDEHVIPYDLILRLLEKICFEDIEYLVYSAAILIFMPGLAEIRRLNDSLVEHPKFGSNDFRIYPLHSTLSSENQGAVFDLPPLGIRKIVISTNIAETGITIPDITCVIDAGKHREMRFDEKRQISRLVETFVAKSNAAQRRGRAGRVQRGLCFHLFTKFRHDTQMVDNPLPEMMRLGLSDLALKIKIMKVNLGTSIEDVLSRALDPPVSINVQRAISMLVEVRALTPSEDITPLGRLLSKLPTDVHLGKFLLISTLFHCLDPALTIAATLNSKSPFITPLGLEQEADRAKNYFRVENSDFLTIHNAFCSWRRACANPSSVREFCRINYLSHQNLQQIEELRQQFLGFLVDTSFIQVDKSFVRELGRLRYGRNRTRFVNIPPELDQNSRNVSLINAALVAGLYPKVLAIDSKSGQMRTIGNNQNTSFHPSSINFGKKPTDFGVNYLSYFTLMHSKKLYAWETGPADDTSILLLCGECDFKLIANTTSIDRRIRFQISPKTNIAVKFLRDQLLNLLSAQFRGQPLTEAYVRWNELALLILGRMKSRNEKDEQPSMIC